MPLMLRLFRALFPSKERQEFQSRLREPLPSAPPPLPPPKLKYVLYTNGDGSYDIWDGGISQSKQSVDGFFKQPGVDYDAKRNGFKQSGFARLFQAL